MFQALVYPNYNDTHEDEKIALPILYIGKILSATTNRVFEHWAENYLKNLTFPYKSLMNLANNYTARVSLFSELFHREYDNTLINIYLDKLY